ncbi:MAG: hypothetical protein B6242_07545 [Anaerolineaceae bacterium 4572_78]|nr:MAG: hypothetical protein B6242_07545 [Anaerolineaceae bacterium 4572_78]
MTKLEQAKEKIIMENSHKLVSRFASIQTQLILGFGLILVLAFIIAIIGYLSLYNLQSNVDTTLDEAYRIRELSLEIENEFLLARQNENAFLDNWRNIGFEIAMSKYVWETHHHLKQAKEKLDEITYLFNITQDEKLIQATSEVEQLPPLLSQYESAFLTTVADIKNLSRTNGVEHRLREQWLLLNNMVKPLPDPTFYQLVLQIQANEQAYFNTDKKEYIDNIHLLILEFEETAKTSATENLTIDENIIDPSKLIFEMDKYLDLFNRLVELEEDVKINTDIFQALTITITSMLALSLGLLAAFVLVRRIIPPLRQLSHVAYKIGQGDLTQEVIISGHDEFAMLANVFNHMTTQLRGLIGLLEDKVEKRTHRLKLVAILSEQLNAILNIDQLLLELDTTIKLLQVELDGYFVGLWLLTDDKNAFHLRIGTGREEITFIYEDYQVDMSDNKGIFRHVYETGTHYLTNDATNDAMYEYIDKFPNTRAELTLPVRIGQEFMGVLDIQSDRSDAFDSKDDMVFQMVANQIAISLRNARMYGLEKKLRSIEEERAAKLSELNASKDRFFSIVAHDLKGPFHPLLGMVELLIFLADNGDYDDMREMLESVQVSTNNVYSLLENLLEWSRMERGHMPFEPVRIDLHEVGNNIVELLTPNANEKGVNLLNGVPENIFVHADENMLDTVIRNLTTNALKFTPNDGSVTISARAWEGGDDTERSQELVGSDFIEVSVIDTGIGMSEKDQHKLFRIDTHHTTLGTNKEQGTGLGLIICQEMVEKNKGRIWVESELGKGTTVNFTVPSLAAPTTPSPAHLWRGEEDSKLYFEDDFIEESPFIVPPSKEMRLLYKLAKDGNVDSIIKETCQIAASDEQYLPFKDEVLALAQEFASGIVVEAYQV